MSSKNHRKPRKRADFPRVWDLSRPSVWSTLRYARGPLENLPLPDIDEEAGNALDCSGQPDPGMISYAALTRAIANVLRTPARPQMYRLYELLLQPGFMYEKEIAAFEISDHPGIAPGPLTALAKFLVFNAPDRYPVKWALSWLSLCRDPEIEEIAGFLGQHEIFAKAAGSLLKEHANDPDMALWILAQKHQGQGRVAIVRKIRWPDNPEIKAWLLREGFRNTVGNELLALQAARMGDLLSELRNPEPDQALIDGATEIFRAFVEPALNDGWYEYADGQEAFARWLDHVRTAPNDNQRRLIRCMVRLFVRNPQFYRELPWSEPAIAEALKRCRDILT
ncbi:hypothetical protein [Halocynthiibacter styelae]|uniref:Uncharacterized protein n=1 Tax=Halocynthiibacter styelae TaxID=2761955 RepID=A0A8J7LVP5_9RHOB|nr:hypothetical protein [Paenihalocynthiibacter styelae]MBI1493342.1 hypothetical protein [Paenihalocynthiibacter styelae]